MPSNISEALGQDLLVSLERKQFGFLPRFSLDLARICAHSENAEIFFAMPRATTDRFHRAHQASVRKPGGISSGKDGKKEESTSGAGHRNPLFNTERFGQHILKNPKVAQTIVDRADLRSSDHVLEVGPGTGNLTLRILDSAKHITAVEMDPRMAAELTKRIQSSPHHSSKLSLIIGDFTKAELPHHFDVCISNTPYQISSPLVFRLLSHAAQYSPPWRCAVLTFQREFALRLCAQPATSLWSRLSANVQLYAKVQHIAKIDKNSFRPPPKVESSIVKMEPIIPPPPIRFEEFDGMNRIIFSRANKTVRGNFSAKGVKEMCERNWRTWCAENDKIIEDSADQDFKTILDGALVESGYAEERAAKMGINDLLKLLTTFHVHGIHFA